MPDAQSQVANSILHDTKQILGQEWDDPTYDLDIMTHINSVFFTLNQLGVGPDDGYMITDANAKWDDYLEGNKNLNAVKSYMYLRVRLMFDPPQNSFLITNIKGQIEQMEWRLQVEKDPPAPPSYLGEINE